MERGSWGLRVIRFFGDMGLIGIGSLFEIWIIGPGETEVVGGEKWE